MYNTLHEVLEENINNIKMNFNNTSDLNIREIKFGTKNEMMLNVVYLDGLVDSGPTPGICYISNNKDFKHKQTYNQR
jgi:hypothetical protein